MRVESYKNEYERVTEVYPFEGRSTSITVSKDKRIGRDEWKPVTINWPGCGGVSPENARAFAEAILKAVEIAGEEEQERKG